MSDISEHLPILEKLAQDKVVLELGVRGGESTKAFLNTCASLTSVDRDDCSKVAQSSRWTFIQGDSLKIVTRLYSFDVVFIDTSHRYHETLEELRHYSTRLKDRGMLVLHDANPPFKAKYLRFRGGVMKAIMKFMNEESGLWEMTYYENNNGLAILKRR